MGNNKKLKYELTGGEANYLLKQLDRVQITGVKAAESLLHVTELLRNPLNKEDLEKEQLEELKDKYEKKEPKK